MSRRRYIAVMRTLILLIVFITLPLSAETKIEDLAWMTGQWKVVQGNTTTEEHWLEPRGGTLLGVSRTVKGDRTVAYEFIRIAVSDGNIVYFASPGGRSPATPFTLKESGDRRVVFENPTHDFPQRIIYWRDGASLCARVEATVNGKNEGEEWCWGQ